MEGSTYTVLNFHTRLSDRKLNSFDILAIDAADSGTQLHDAS